MKNAIIYLTFILMITSIIGACKSDEDDAATTSSNTCTGTSSGSGPTIGSVALEEATYLSSCFSGKKIQLQFKNSTEAQYTSYAYGNSTCSGSVTDESSACMNSITVSSTAVSKPTWNNDNGSLNPDNVSGSETPEINRNAKPNNPIAAMKTKTNFRFLAFIIHKSSN